MRIPLRGRYLFSKKYNVVDHAEGIDDLDDVKKYFKTYKRQLKSKSNLIPVFYTATDPWVVEYVPLLDTMDIITITSCLGDIPDEFTYIPHWLIAVDMHQPFPANPNLPKMKWQYWVRKNRLHRVNLLEKMLELKPMNSDIVFLKDWNGIQTKDLFTNKDLYNSIDTYVRKNNDLQPGENGAYVPSYNLRYNIALEVISETRMESIIGEIFFSEKTYRPIRAGQLFLLQGQFNAVDELRKLGFKTFDNVIDHSYDNIKDESKRTDALFNELKRLHNLSTDEWHDMWITTYNDRLFNQQHSRQTIQDWYHK